jgi:hypothetical protein
MALAGGLLRGGVEPGKAREVIRALADATDDNRPRDRVALVKDAAARLDTGQPVVGWPRLAEILGDEGRPAVLRLRRALGLTVTIKDLAKAKRLPAEFLANIGLHDLAHGGIGIPYQDQAGRTVVVKERHALAGPRRFFWPAGQPLMAYGQDRLHAAVAAGRLTLVEGESDVWALWHHGEPALGLPGADTAGRTLLAEHLAGVTELRVLQEGDAGGADFVAGVRRRLGELAWVGRLKVVRLPVKDAADLHADDPGRFEERWAAAVDQAESVEVPAAATPAALPAGPPWPEKMAPEAFHGLAGEIVRTLEPASEADPGALLLQILVGFGNLLGRTAHCTVEADRHFGNESIVLVGPTSKARKGTSWGHVRRLLAAVDEPWGQGRVLSGLSSGEGVIWQVRDPIAKRERIKERGEPVRYETIEADPGVSDKRLLIVEPEFASVLRMAERQGSSLSAVLRLAWDTGDLATLTKNTPARATGAHVSLIGHVTAEELRRYLSTTEMANGFGNRNLWACCRRSKLLPDGGQVDGAALRDLTSRLGEALAFGRGLGEVGRDEDARALWREVYAQLSADRPGLTGAMLGRAEAHVLRLSLLYAVLDKAPAVGAPHLMAALAVWDYCEASVRKVFGDALGDPVADDLLRLLRGAPDGLTRWEISNALGRNVASDRIGRALALLAENGLARMQRQSEGPGRPAERWHAGRLAGG